MRKEGEPSIQSHMTKFMLAWHHEGEVVTNCQSWNGPTTSVYQTQLFEAFKDPTCIILAWRLRNHTFHPCLTGALEIIAHPCFIIMTCHPSYHCILWGDVCNMRLDPRFPLFLSYIEKIREPGDKAADQPGQALHHSHLPGIIFRTLSANPW